MTIVGTHGAKKKKSKINIKKKMKRERETLFSEAPYKKILKRKKKKEN
jgi:hypothetical protein